MNGIDAAREISKAHPRLPMLLLSVQEVSEQLVQAALSAGFKGAITKGSGREVVDAIEAVLCDRVKVGGLCDEQTLEALSLGKRALIISDCEGYEKKLFTERLVARLRRHDC